MELGNTERGTGLNVACLVVVAAACCSKKNIKPPLTTGNTSLGKKNISLEAAIMSPGFLIQKLIKERATVEKDS